MDNGVSNEIRREMERIRRELDHDVGEVVEQAKELADWHSFVRSHPWLCTAAAASVGFLLVPRRLNVVSPSADTLAKLAKQNRLVVTPKLQVEQSRGALSSIVNLVASAALRGVVTATGQYVRKLWTDDPRMSRSPASQTAPGASDDDVRS